MIWSSRERNRSCSLLSRRSRGRIANPPLHQLEREESRLAIRGNPQNRFARKSPSKGQKPANSITLSGLNHPAHSIAFEFFTDDYGATPCRLRSRLSIAARSQALRQFGSVRLFRVQRLCPSYRGQSCAACSYQYRYQSCGQWRLSCRAWWCAPRALRKPLNWLCEPLGAGARPVHPIRVYSRQRSTSVVFGAKGTFTTFREVKKAPASP